MEKLQNKLCNTDTTRQRLICDKIDSDIVQFHRETSRFIDYLACTGGLGNEFLCIGYLETRRDQLILESQKKCHILLTNSWCAINWAEIGAQLLFMFYPEVSAGWPQQPVDRQTESLKSGPIMHIKLKVGANYYIHQAVYKVKWPIIEARHTCLCTYVYIYKRTDHTNWLPSSE